MKQEFFTVIPQNMREYQMSIREADNENDIFRMAFDEVMKGHAFDLNNRDDLDKYMLSWDAFKDGWKAAVRLLNDDAERASSSAAREAARQSIEHDDHFQCLLWHYIHARDKLANGKFTEAEATLAFRELIDHIDTWGGAALAANTATQKEEE